MKKIFISGIIAVSMIFGGYTTAFAATLSNTNTSVSTSVNKTAATKTEITTYADTDSVGVVNSPIGLYMRNEASLNGGIITALDYGVQVTIEGTVGNWYKVSANGFTGYVYKEYITLGQGVASSGSSTSSTISSSYGVVSNLNPGYTLNFRTEPNTSSYIIGSFENGTEVQILGETNGWYNIDYNGQIGYVYGEFITLTNSSSNSSNSTTSSSSSSNSSVTAQDIISYAKQFEGYPYVWGGSSPSTGFDCSGFVQYVFAHFGIDLPRTTFEQVYCGTPVSLSNIQPGDLVFEIPTSEGPNHVGIYIGNGQMIDAEGIGQGVTISPLYEVVAVRNVL